MSWKVKAKSWFIRTKPWSERMEYNWAKLMAGDSNTEAPENVINSENIRTDGWPLPHSAWVACRPVPQEVLDERLQYERQHDPDVQIVNKEQIAQYRKDKFEEKKRKIQAVEKMLATRKQK